MRSSHVSGYHLRLTFPRAKLRRQIFMVRAEVWAKNWAKNWAKFSAHFRASFAVQNDPQIFSQNSSQFITPCLVAENLKFHLRELLGFGGRNYHSFFSLGGVFHTKRVGTKKLFPSLKTLGKQIFSPGFSRNLAGIYTGPAGGVRKVSAKSVRTHRIGADPEKCCGFWGSGLHKSAPGKWGGPRRASSSF